MYRTMMKAKIHRARVTESNLNYVGSITIDEDIMDAVDILENEKVQIVNNNNGARFETYVIKGPRGSKVICLNGAAARLVQKDDVVIILSYVMVEESKAATHTPRVAIMDETNQIVEMLGTEPASTVM
ncbi:MULTISPECIES: aspartate 1-decarboxylase [Alkalihalophilus]|uniref:Aspartate 1-decarboxylase n=2 Tax=Alkalihalophilus pseudofirmus TaxID=79885 RepID=D3G0K9_ALKPO|nr:MULTISPECIES: aspartate 1-decarboxylase [Alkalihalophilus]ADC51171.1 aspartate alpha-decarboxylase [Alkalihalophilus pseudofirmus OF4]MDV2884362.1 aspartate 1-decarboxylase [Alkalihalophilus pseudofirmus]MEC2070851.1 aspartate 1-decarboxylase [Alkalihalophilus marmarensis]MED1601540.1 aspartate 1-decarboxylase [Alkalihalophilus marmarensis]OLS37983.1 aspartate 1-decarboxylase [Alkalihalophilus pseudofirmus]